MARPDLEAEWSAATAAVRQKHLHVLTNKYGIPATVILDCQIASNRDPLFASNSDPSGRGGMGLSA